MALIRALLCTFPSATPLPQALIQIIGGALSEAAAEGVHELAHGAAKEPSHCEAEEEEDQECCGHDRAYRPHLLLADVLCPMTVTLAGAVRSIGTRMCGRFSNQAPHSTLRERFAVELPENAGPRVNVAPTQQVLAVRRVDDEPAAACFLRWGLIPHWARDEKSSYRMINARAETLQEKSSYRTLLDGRRCLIPADGFYEWRTGADGKKQPIWFRVDGDAPFAFAGLWTSWRDRERDQTIESCTIITTTPNELVSRVHNRMPVILDREAERAWLDPELDGQEAVTLLLPYPAEHMSAFAVSSLLNNARRDDPALLLDPVPLDKLAA